VQQHSFFIVDVFAEDKYSGNQLAVFLDSHTIPDDEMQRIAREINFSETTFILHNEARNGGFDVRIFTPKEEVQFAGHPTLGTAFIIRNQILKNNTENLILNLPVGQIPVVFTQDNCSWMTQINPVFSTIHTIEILASILGLTIDELDDRFPVQEVSTGLPFFIVPLKTIDSVNKCRINLEKYFEFVNKTVAKGILVFCSQPLAHSNDLNIRVFADYYGVPEDPATGSANGCLAGYLVKYNYFGKKSIDIRCEQGVQMGRPSLLQLRAEQQKNEIYIQVGGKCFTVASGQFF
jgi:trans-2,3-dihydro-3-hydroxyanthranilate isomerase